MKCSTGFANRGAGAQGTRGAAERGDRGRGRGLGSFPLSWPTKKKNMEHQRRTKKVKERAEKPLERIGGGVITVVRGHQVI